MQIQTITTMQANKNKLFLMGLLLLPMFNYAQVATSQESTTLFSNALFNTLVVLIIALLIVIIALAQTLKNIASSDVMLNKFKTQKDNSEKPSATEKIASVIFLLFMVQQLPAANEASTGGPWIIGGLDSIVFYSLAAVIFVEALVILLLYNTIMGFIKTEKPVVAKTVKSKSILEVLNASVDIENEQDITLDHEYDGIRELDNDLPPWWKYGFYLTILIAVIYMIHYHVAKTGDLQLAEYNNSLEEAKIEVAEYMKTAANNVDETTVKQLEGADLASGKEIFVSACAACHGKDGQGTVGPNLTDAYWIHGGSLADIFKSIKYGWVDKGMKSWKDDYSPTQIAQIASYIHTLKGTNPAGAKASQGDLYTEGAQTTSDSTVVKTDTLNLKKTVPEK